MTETRTNSLINLDCKHETEIKHQSKLIVKSGQPEIFTKESELETLAEAGITVEDLAYHLGTTAEEILSGSWQFPDCVTALDVAGRIQALYEERLAGYLWKTRLNGHVYTIGSRVIAKVTPSEDSPLEDEENWDTYIEAIVLSMSEDRVALSPVISYESVDELGDPMTFEEWAERQHSFQGMSMRVDAVTGARFGDKDMTILSVEPPKGKPSFKEFQAAGFTGRYLVPDGRISPLVWRRLHAQHGWKGTPALNTED